MGNENSESLDRLIEEAREILRKAEPSLRLSQAIRFAQYPRHPEPVLRFYSPTARDPTVYF